MRKGVSIPRLPAYIQKKVQLFKLQTSPLEKALNSQNLPLTAHQLKAQNFLGKWKTLDTPQFIQHVSRAILQRPRALSNSQFKYVKPLKQRSKLKQLGRWLDQSLVLSEQMQSGQKLTFRQSILNFAITQISRIMSQKCYQSGQLLKRIIEANKSVYFDLIQSLSKRVQTMQNQYIQSLIKLHRDYQNMLITKIRSRADIQNQNINNKKILSKLIYQQQRQKQLNKHLLSQNFRLKSQLNQLKQILSDSVSKQIFSLNQNQFQKILASKSQSKLVLQFLSIKNLSQFEVNQLQKRYMHFLPPSFSNKFSKQIFKKAKSDSKKKSKKQFYNFFTQTLITKSAQVQISAKFSVKQSSILFSYSTGKQKKLAYSILPHQQVIGTPNPQKQVQEVKIASLPQIESPKKKQTLSPNVIKISRTSNKPLTKLQNQRKSLTRIIEGQKNVKVEEKQRLQRVDSLKSIGVQSILNQIQGLEIDQQLQIKITDNQESKDFLHKNQSTLIWDSVASIKSLLKESNQEKASPFEIYENNQSLFQIKKNISNQKVIKVLIKALKKSYAQFKKNTRVCFFLQTIFKVCLLQHQSFQTASIFYYNLNRIIRANKENNQFFENISLIVGHNSQRNNLLLIAYLKVLEIGIKCTKTSFNVSNHCIHPGHIIERLQMFQQDVSPLSFKKLHKQLSSLNPQIQININIISHFILYTIKLQYNSLFYPLFIFPLDLKQLTATLNLLSIQSKNILNSFLQMADLTRYKKRYLSQPYYAEFLKKQTQLNLIQLHKHLSKFMPKLNKSMRQEVKQWLRTLRQKEQKTEYLLPVNV